jgi:hypothetical protein
MGLQVRLAEDLKKGGREVGGGTYCVFGKGEYGGVGFIELGDDIPG